MKIQLGIGAGTQTVEVPDRCVQQVLEPNPVPHGLTGEAEVRRALAEPIGTPRLREIVRPGETIAIITSDITRPMPTWTVMPPLLDELYEAGIRPQDITLVFALGSHRPHTAEEMRRLAGERAFQEIRCVDGDPEDCVRLGVTSRGTPVDITRVVAEADRRICLGNIEYHYFAGYSGGAKAIMPGVSTRAAIQANHSMMVQEAACAGNLDTNPLRQDIEEAAALGLVEGDQYGRFNPDSALTRQDMMVLVDNFVELPEANGLGFDDDGNIALWALEAAARTTAAGLFGGSGGRLSPSASATRAEAAQVVSRVLELA